MLIALFSEQPLMRLGRTQWCMKMVGIGIGIGIQARVDCDTDTDSDSDVRC